MYSFVTSKNVKWCHLIWARHPVVVPGRVLYTVVLDRIMMWSKTSSQWTSWRRDQTFACQRSWHVQVCCRVNQ